MIEERKLTFHSCLFKDTTKFTGLLVKKKITATIFTQNTSAKPWFHSEGSTVAYMAAMLQNTN